MALFNKEQGQSLLNLARATLTCRFSGDEPPEPPKDEIFIRQLATFVTLKIDGRLRGCIGNLQAAGPVWRGVCDNVINAAFHDHRFSALSPEELAQIHIEISLLTPPQPLLYKNPEELRACLRPGVDGVVLGDGRRSATFLPQVWQQLPTVELFLKHLCLKAGLSERAWLDKPLNIEIYQVQSFAEDEA